MRTALMGITASLFLASTAMGTEVHLVRTPDGGIQPQAVVDKQGKVHLVYYKGEAGGGDLFYVHGRPGEFSPPQRVNTEARSAIAAGTIRGAQIALGRNSRVHVAWNGRAPEGGTHMDAPMLYTRSKEDGHGFERERNVITQAWGLDGGGSVAADSQGNVYVMWHAPKPGDTNGEPGRAVFFARSGDDGRTFAPEKMAAPVPTGACGCCGMKSFADDQGNVVALFRSATTLTNRDEVLLLSRDRAKTFEIVYRHGWKVAACPMSSAFLAPAGSKLLAAAETHQRVFFIRVDPKTGRPSQPVSPEGKGKYPVLASNRRGEILLAWVEGTSWGRGGTLAWQIYDSEGRPIGTRGGAEGVPAWSMAGALAMPDDNFVIVY